MDHLKDAMQRLNFDSAAALGSLDRTASSVNMLEWTLRDVPLRAREIDVCDALAAWATAEEEEEFETGSIDENRHAADGGGAGGGGGGGGVGVRERTVPFGPWGEEKLLDVDQRLLDQVNLEALSADDLCRVRARRLS
jgi:hypothetical protein